MRVFSSLLSKCSFVVEDDVKTNHRWKQPHSFCTLLSAATTLTASCKKSLIGQKGRSFLVREFGIRPNRSCKNPYPWHCIAARCLKITEKVSFNIASEASYVYILSGQKLIKKAKKWLILASFWKPEACGQTVLPDRSVLKGQKLVGNAKIQNFKWDIFKQCVL